MAMAQKFEITFDTIPILDSDQTDKLGYVLTFDYASGDMIDVALRWGINVYDILCTLKLTSLMMGLLVISARYRNLFVIKVMLCRKGKYYTMSAKKMCS